MTSAKPMKAIIIGAAMAALAVSAIIILAATGFMNFAGEKKANRQSFWIKEMKLPEVAD